MNRGKTQSKHLKIEMESPHSKKFYKLPLYTSLSEGVFTVHKLKPTVHKLVLGISSTTQHICIDSFKVDSTYLF